MRLITRSIWRAFPELDRFSDDQGRRFVRAANARPVARVFTMCVALMMAGLTSLAALVLPIIMMSIRTRGFTTIDAGAVFDHNLMQRVWYWAYWCFTGVIAGLLTRDVLLRLRVRRIVRTRGSCIQCHYSLLGLAVPDNPIIACPECGTPTHVDAALGELTRDAAGHCRFTPRDHAHLHPASPRARRTLRLLTRLALALPLLAGFALLSYEAFLHVQARAARADRVPPSFFSDFVAERNPTVSGASSIYVPLMQSETHANAAKAALATAIPPHTIDGRTINWASVSDVYATFDPGLNPTPLDLAVQLRGRQLFEFYQRSPLRDLLDEIAQAGDVRRSYDYLPQDGAFMVLLPELGQMREMARYNAARMHVAREARDTAEWLRALRSSFALARASDSQCTAIQFFTACAIDAMITNDIVRMLNTHPDAQTLDAIEMLLVEYPPLPLADLLPGVEASDIDTLAWVFANPAHVRWGRLSRGVTFALGASNTEDRVTIGTYAHNRRVLLARHAWTRSLLDQPAHLQIRSTPPAHDDLTLIRMLQGEGTDRHHANRLLPRRILENDAARRARRDALFVMLALERFFLATGEYPDSLDRLTPAYLAVLRADPWSPAGKPLRYRRIDPQLDSACRGYLLYTVAGDGIDDAGATASFLPEPASLWTPTRRLPPVDYVFNHTWP